MKTPVQLFHIQVDGKSWCRCHVTADTWLAAPRRLALSCSHSDRATADAMAEYLRTIAKMPAVVVDGPCRQQDEEDWDNA